MSKEVPQEILRRAMHDPIINAAIHQYQTSDMSKEEFLIKLVCMLSDMCALQNKKLIERLERGD